VVFLGLLHILLVGWDHETEGEKQEAKEKEYQL
jgi:ssRNA-specific RNase YbeY (16S rRNA maturation enzyme)